MRSLDDIVDEIVLELGDVEGRALVLPEAETRTTVRRAIENANEFFARWDRFFSREGRATIAKAAAEVAALIAPLESS